MQDLSANIAWSFLSVNMQNNIAPWYNCMIITWKGVLKTVQHNTVLFVMESRVSSNCTCNIHRLSSEKEVNWKENTVGKIARRRQIQKSTHDQILIEWSAGQLSQIVKILRDFTGANCRKPKAKPNYGWHTSPLKALA